MNLIYYKRGLGFTNPFFFYNMNKNKCKKCGWEWIPRQEKVKVCPKCKTYSWWITKSSKCDICKRTFENLVEHHIDGNRGNNKPKNKIKICVDCHSVIHNGLNEKSSRIRNYKGQLDVINKLKEYSNYLMKVKKKEKKE